jgi:hypothetical protein
MFQTKNREKWTNDWLANIHSRRQIYFWLLTAQSELYNSENILNSFSWEFRAVVALLYELDVQLT